FMRTPAWRVEKLNTLLASWAQLRHNFLLYSNQSYTMTLSKQMEEPALVEANPAFYHAMAQLAGRTLKVLQAAGSQDSKHAKALADYAAKCREFEGYAQAELAGTLTHSQSVEIDKFCDWLHRFSTGSASAMVADVATGMHAETLHAATGDLCTLLVIPDRKTGAVYTGAVSSYYEFTRPNLTRLTDAQWQAQQVQTYLRPERPSWAYAFMAHEGGAEWESRAPLRAAEKLLVDTRTEEALALLRATVRKNSDSALATEAQFRLGRYYFDRHEWAQAQSELQRCERLPGCEAFDQAQNLLREVQGEQQRLEYLQKVAAPARAKGLAELKSLQDAVKALKRTPADAGKEQLLTKRLLSVLPWEDGGGSWQTESSALLRVARGAFRTQPCQDSIGYALLFVGHGGRYHVGSRAESDLALAFSHRVKSLPLRAAVLSLALQDGYLANQPQAALALLRPFLDAHLLTNDSDPALQLVLTPSGKTLGSDDSYTLDLRTDPRELLHTQIAKTLRTLAATAIEAGQIRQAIRYARLYPAGSFGANNGEDMEFTNIIEEWGSISDADLPAASLLAILEGQETKKQTKAMVLQALTLAGRYPHSRYTLIALCKAINSVRGENSPQTRKLKAILAQNYPHSLPALCIAIETAFDRGDLTQTRPLLSNYQARTRGHESEPSSEQDLMDVRYVEYRLSDYDGKVQELKPLLDAANTPEAMRMDRIEANGEPLADVLIQRLPHRAAEIYLTLGRVYQNSALTMRFLERFPSDPQAGEAWKLLSGEDNRSTPGALNYGGPETVLWLAPFVNRHDSNSATAAQLLQKLMGYSSVRLAEEESRIVQDRYPQSRAANVADLATAQVLLTSRRPEAMLAYADRAIAGTEKNDPLHREAVQLRQRAVQEIAAKHR
ncbi:MAG: Por secretion system C-terminal sorting protein, partial [Chthonomonadales bacterium]|nr:Por secretion system C-terminal sorting protein [Chthonomonadales bacterium]